MKLSLEETKASVKRHPVLAVLFILFLLCGLKIGQVFLGNPFKVTNPSSPFFDAKDFSLLDYPPQHLNDALVKIFPVGTDKSYIDFVMYSAGGHPTALGSMSKQIARYDFPPNLRYWYSGAHLMYVFDANEKLLNIHPFGTPNGLYKDQPTLEQVHNQSRSDRN